MSQEDQFHAAFVLIGSLVVIVGLRLWARTKPADQRRHAAAQLYSSRVPLALALSGGAFSLLGLGMYVHASLISVDPCDLAAAESGARIEADFIRVRGFARPEALVCWQGRRGESCYTPITSTPSSQRVALLVDGRVEFTGEQSWEGFTTRSDLAHYRRLVADAGLQPTEDLTRLLRESRDERGRAGLVIGLVGLVLAIGGGLWWRRRRASS